MTTRPTAELRRQVVERAGNCCEYCLLPQELAASTHFRLEGAHLLGMTIEGRTTVAFLRLNAVERLMERTAFLRAGRYPPDSGHH